MGFGKRVESMLDLPEGSLSGEVFVEICGNGQVIVNGDCEILCYEEDMICLKARKRTMRLSGSRLAIETLTSGGVVIAGALAAVEFL